ncbi:phage tail protein [Providencia rettgeri]
MASVITIAFENWKAQEAASGKAVLLDEFVFANVPNLDPTKPIDRNEKLPPANQIVHRQAVNKAGLASENAVAYSVTMGADVGNFDFNWIGLLNKASGTIAMITHAPTQKKLKTQNGQQGNVLTRSFILEFQGAAEETQIKTSAETWQIDFTARLSGIDEMQRLINVDSYGAAAFFNDGFEVTRSGEQYTVKKGLGYVGGLRGELAQNQILNGLRNTKVYADFSYQGNIVSQWNTVIKITAAATLNNYVDAAGFTHQVFAIASVDANGNVKDLRPMGALSSQSLADFEKKFNQGLDKKQDKGDYALRGESYTKTETNIKFQPIGNYQPSGDYATNTTLNNGLGLKFDKTDVVQSAGTSKTQVMSQDAATKAFMKFGDYGWGGNKENNVATSEESISAMLKSLSTPSQIYRNGQGTAYAAAYAANAYFKVADTWMNISASQRDDSITITAGTQNAIRTSNLYTSSNTTKDRSGFLRTGEKNAVITEDIVQNSGKSTTQMMSQGAVTDISFGIEQVWVNVTTQRSSGVVYTNSTKKAISVALTQTSVSQTAVIDISVGGVDIAHPAAVTGSSRNCITFIVPAGSTYRVISTGSNITNWSELR